MIDQDLLDGNKYFKWYWSICNRAKDRVLSPDIYVEKHHIYPKSIYGQNQDLVKLTAKEHYIVHLLLWRGLRFKFGTKDKFTKKMAYAFNMMNCISPDNDQRIKIKNADEYSFLKISRIESNIDYKHTNETKLKISKKALDRFKNKENHPNFNKPMKDSQKAKLIGRFVSDETKEKQRLSHIDKKRSDESKKKQSLSRIGKKDSDETRFKKSNHQKKCVYQYDIEKRVILHKYDSIKDAYINTGIKGISACCNYNQKTAGGFIWSLNILSDEELNYMILKSKKEYNPIVKKVYQYDLDYKLIEIYDSVIDAFSKTNIYNISNCCRNLYKSAGGYIWKYEKINETNV